VRRLLVLVLPLVLLAGACTSSHPQPTPSSTESPSTSPSASPTGDAAAALAALAALSAKSSYSAVYLVRGSSSGTASIVRTPHGYRFELATGSPNHRRDAILLQTIAGTISCTVRPAPLTCLRVAGPGKPVPAVFDAGLQHVFSDYLVTLSTPSDVYAVATAPAGPGDGQCFTVSVTATPPPTNAVAAGTYCFGPSGLPTRVVYPSGRLVLSARGPAPRGSDFVPPATPRPLP
jgi:hypothetical protein